VPDFLGYCVEDPTRKGNQHPKAYGRTRASGITTTHADDTNRLAPKNIPLHLCPSLGLVVPLANRSRKRRRLHTVVFLVVGHDQHPINNTLFFFVSHLTRTVHECKNYFYKIRQRSERKRVRCFRDVHAYTVCV